MIETLTIESFKSIQSITLELGQVNVFIGANGSGKSNLLEALAVLSAAASGRVDQSTLVWRGCRASNYFMPMFEGCDDEASTRLFAESDRVFYDVTLQPPPSFRLSPWGFKVEQLKHKDQFLLNRPESNGNITDPEIGLAALRLAEIQPGHSASLFLKALASYSIYSANSSILHGWVKDYQEREPVGLGGGRLANAIHELCHDKEKWKEYNIELRSCMDWFGDSVLTKRGSDSHSEMLDFGFTDRYFKKDDETPRSPVLRANDVNEGILYLTFLAVLALHPLAPKVFAVENIDHGLNPLLAKRLISTLTEQILAAQPKRQVFLTTHNPLVLDGLPLADDRVRLFTVDRDNRGHTVVQRIDLERALKARPNDEWTLSRMWVNGLIGGVPNV
ncbi:AAA family ATPase [Prosthecobacter sp.]|uniref:AAA family ATPase n=1 Tax=Prosthecobacter sp. TaxID=1965333 RepID=UPI003785055B